MRFHTELPLIIVGLCFELMSSGAYLLSLFYLKVAPRLSYLLKVCLLLLVEFPLVRLWSLWGSFPLGSDFPVTFVGRWKS